MSACPTLEEVVQSKSFHPLLPTISRILEKSLVRGNDDVATAFSGKVDSSTPPLDRFLYRFAKYGGCSKEVFVMMMVYLSRHAAKTGLDLTAHNAHRLIIAAFLAAVKIREDMPYCNVYYSKLGGVSIQELNQLERVFLVGIDFDLEISAADYNTMVESLTTVSLCDAFCPQASPPLRPAGHRAPVRAAHKYDFPAPLSHTAKTQPQQADPAGEPLAPRGSALRAIRARLAVMVK